MIPDFPASNVYGTNRHLSNIGHQFQRPLHRKLCISKFHTFLYYGMSFDLFQPIYPRYANSTNNKGQSIHNLDFLGSCCSTSSMISSVLFSSSGACTVLSGCSGWSVSSVSGYLIVSSVPVLLWPLWVSVLL